MMPLRVRPAIEPIRKATWLIPRERPSSSAGVASTIMAALFVNRIADPRPWTARNAITWAGSTARLVRSEPTVNTANPLVYSLTRPTMSEMPDEQEGDRAPEDIGLGDPDRLFRVRPEARGDLRQTHDHDPGVDPGHQHAHGGDRQDRPLVLDPARLRRRLRATQPWATQLARDEAAEIR